MLRMVANELTEIILNLRPLFSAYEVQDSNSIELVLFHTTDVFHPQEEGQMLIK
jgi:hypothetical protein